MAPDDELHKKILLILSGVKGNLGLYRLTEKALFAARLENAARAGMPGAPISNLTDSIVVNEQVRLLKTLRGQRDHSEESFVKILVGEVKAENAAVIVHALIELGRLDAVISMAVSRALIDLPVRCEIWSAIGEKIRREPHRFTDADLETIDAVREKEKGRIPKQSDYESDSSYIRP